MKYEEIMQALDSNRSGNSWMPAGSELNPPWCTEELWQTANHEIERLIKNHYEEFEGARITAKRILGNIESLFPLMDDLCTDYCSGCQSPCCFVGITWADFQDLIFSHLTCQPVMPLQTVHDFSTFCRYLEPNGCTLPRLSRPWICTGYLCESQWMGLKKKGAEIVDHFGRTIITIREDRDKMEEEFNRVVNFKDYMK